jgi:metal-responsive CopG/Arc/MetJ family transcriptional regulator
MQNVKTAISMQKALFEQAEELAHTMKVSRSRLFVLALQEYIERRKNRELLTRINAAYEEPDDATEKKLRRAARRRHRRLVEGEW